ncbi:DUF115 domain-containing protein [Leptospira sp. 96542]|nr:DUF115 domain-containing protein [Leptospira sp. 96542]
MSQITDPISSEIFSRKPYLQNYFKDFGSNHEWKLSQAKQEGEYYVSLGKNPLASTFSPLTQAKRLLETLSLKPTDVVILFGLGNPHLPLIISETLAPGQIFIMVGEDEKLTSVLWDNSLKQVLNVPGRHIFSGDMFFPMLFNYLESLPIDRVSGLKIIKNPADYSRNPIYKDLEDKIQTVFSAKMSDLLTKFEFEKLWIKNSIWNLIHVGKTPPYKFPIHILEKKFEGLTAVLVSAGPSLRKNLHWLEANRDKLFILSCDTSLKVLLKKNILPDGVVTLDAQTNSFFHFMGEELQDIPLFADLVSSPTLLREPMFRTVIHSVTAKYQVDADGSLVREVTAGGELADQIFASLGDIQSGGSVATTAFDMLRFMGFKKIFFIGQDLAYSGREIHSTGTHHNEKWLTLVNRKSSLERINEVIIRKRETREVPSNNGNTVLTDYVLDLYRHWFEESANTVNDMELCNIGEDGATINGFQNLNLLGAFQKMETVANHHYPWRNMEPWLAINLRKIHHKTNGPKYLYERIKNDLQKMEDGLDSFEKNKEEIDFQNAELWTWIKEQSYLRRMVRKTEIYILRHRELETKRKNQIMIQSIRKEVRYLKRSLYPMSGLFPENG